MGRPTRFSDDELKQITLEAIEDATENGSCMVNVTIADVERYAQKNNLKLKRHHLRENIVKKILDSHSKEVSRIYGFSLKDFNGSRDFLETFNYVEFLRKNERNLEQAMYELGKHFNRVLRHDYFMSLAVKRKEVNLEGNASKEENEYKDIIRKMQETINELKKQNKELKESLKLRMDFIRKMAKKDQYLMLEAAGIPKGSIPTDPEIDIQKEIERMQEENEKDNILFFKKMREEMDIEDESK